MSAIEIIICLLGSALFSLLIMFRVVSSWEKKNNPAPPKPAPPPPPPKPEPKPAPTVSTTDANDESSLFLKFGLALLKYGIVFAISLFCSYNIFYEQGFEAGEQSAYSEGYEKGKAAGYKEGYAEGEDNGYDYGYNIGYQNGKTAQQDGSLELVSDNSTNRFSSRSMPEQSRTVYVTRTGTKYHKATCYHLSESRIEIDLNSAKSKGYTPCRHCGG